MQKNNQKCDVSETAKRMIKTNQVIISEHCIKHGDGLLAVSDGDEKKLEKVIMRSFWTQNLHEIGRVCLGQIQLKVLQAY